MKGLMNPKDPKGHLKRHWVSLRMSAAALPKNGPKVCAFYFPCLMIFSYM